MIDEKVLANLKKGDKVSLALLWKLHSKNVLNLAFQILRNRDDAEDILMDVFVLVPQRVQNFRGESALSTWLYRITVNECLMKLRADKRHRELERLNHDSIVERNFGNAETPVCKDGKILQLALAELSAETRSMLWLHDAENVSIDELVSIYDMPSGTIKARLSRARVRVREFLKEKSNA